MDKLVTVLARIMALLGGIVLLGLILMTCASIIGREINSFFTGDFAEGAMPGLAAWGASLGLGPVFGDVELVEAGVAFVIFSFIPLCQLRGAHAKVDIFTSRLSPPAARVLQAVIDVVFAAALILIAWRLTVGLAEKQQYSETSFMLQFPVWWAYAASLTAASIAALTGVYIALARLRSVMTGQEWQIAPTETEF